MSNNAVTTNKKNISLSQLKLPTVSQHGLKALEMINTEDVQFSKLESILSSDPMLMGILIKYANSPIYRKHIETTNIRQAINLLGFSIVKSSILICTMRSYCEPVNEAKEMLWKSSMHLSIMAKLLASNISRKLADEVELTAMMSEIGGFVLSSNFPDEYDAIVLQSKEKNIALFDAEYEYFGLERAEVTSFTLKKLRLPQTTMDALDGYLKKEVPYRCDRNNDKQLAVLILASIIIENEPNIDIIQDDDLYNMLLERLELSNLNLEKLLENYEEVLLEGQFL